VIKFYIHHPIKKKRKRSHNSWGLSAKGWIGGDDGKEVGMEVGGELSATSFPRKEERITIFAAIRDSLGDYHFQLICDR